MDHVLNDLLHLVLGQYAQVGQVKLHMVSVRRHTSIYIVYYINIRVCLTGVVLPQKVEIT